MEVWNEALPKATMYPSKLMLLSISHVPQMLADIFSSCEEESHQARNRND